MPQFNSRVVHGELGDHLSMIIHLFREALFSNKFTQKQIEEDWITQTTLMKQRFYRKDQWKVELRAVHYEVLEYIIPVIDAYMSELIQSNLVCIKNLPQIDYDHLEIHHPVLLAQELFRRIVYKMFRNNTTPETAKDLLAVFEAFSISLNQSPTLKTYTVLDRALNPIVNRPGRFSSINENLLGQKKWVLKFRQGIEFVAKVKANQGAVSEAIKHANDRLHLLKIHWVAACSAELNLPAFVAHCAPLYIAHLEQELRTQLTHKQENSELSQDFILKKNALNELQEEIDKIKETLTYLQSLLQLSGWVMILMGVFDLEKLANQVALIDDKIIQFEQSNSRMQKEYLPALVDHSAKGLSDKILSSVDCATLLNNLQSTEVQKEILYLFTTSIRTCLKEISNGKITDFICHARLNQLNTWFLRIEHDKKHKDGLLTRRRISTMETAESGEELRPEPQGKPKSQPKPKIVVIYPKQKLSIFLEIEEVLTKKLHTNESSDFTGENKKFVKEHVAKSLDENLFCNTFHENIYQYVLKPYEKAAQRGRYHSVWYSYSGHQWATLVRNQSRLIAALELTQTKLYPLSGQGNKKMDPTYQLQLDCVDRVLTAALGKMAYVMPWHKEVKAFCIEIVSNFSQKISSEESPGKVGIQLPISLILEEELQKQKKEEIDERVAWELNRMIVEQTLEHEEVLEEQKEDAAECAHNNAPLFGSRAVFFDSMVPPDNNSLNESTQLTVLGSR